MIIGHQALGTGHPERAIQFSPVAAPWVNRRPPICALIMAA